VRVRRATGTTLRRGLTVLVLVASIAAPGRAPAADAPPLVPAPLLERLARAAEDLARRGRKDEAAVVVDVHAELRAPAAGVAALRESVAKALAKAKPVPLPIADAAHAMTKLAADIAATLPTLDDAGRRAVARQTVRLDGACRPAQNALGRVERDGVWVSADVLPLLTRRAEIQAAVRAAHKLDVPLEEEEGWLPLLETLYHKKGISVRLGDFSIQSATHSKHQLLRQVREAARAAALANWLVNGELEPPKPVRAHVAAFVASRDDYLRAIDAALAASDITSKQAAQYRTLGGFHTIRYSVFTGTAETEIGANTFFDLVTDVPVGPHTIHGAQPALLAPLMNWIYGGFLGHPMPLIAWTETEATKRGVTSDTPQAAAEREAMLRMAKAGLAGSRAYVRWLARRGEDPAWSRAFLDEIGMIQGDTLMKSTLVADFLFESDEFTRVLKETYGENVAPETFQAAVGCPLPEFEQRWREWLFAGDPPSGLAQTLGTAPTDPVLPAEKAVLAYLDKVRRQTLGKRAPDVGVDRELSDGCRAHALYLTKNTKQLSQWPGAHEEYPDQESYSPEGARAGLSSVIAPGVDGPADAIDGWIGTFYHRLPLLEPGLVRIGWGLEGHVAVLDAGSLVAPTELPIHVPWPAPESKDVPRRFCAELPNPVPGADQSQWGYPVTLQFFANDPDATMRLYVGNTRGGQEIPCHFSTPKKPTNTELAPAGVFCLIPKVPLAANTTYTVAVDGWPKNDAGTDWQFTTGAK
jgi:hypothetical protein